MFLHTFNNMFVPTTFIERVFNNGAANQFDSINMFVNKYDDSELNISKVNIMFNHPFISNLTHQYGFIIDTMDSAIGTSYYTIKNAYFKQIA